MGSGLDFESLFDIAQAVLDQDFDCNFLSLMLTLYWAGFPPYSV